MYTHCQLTRKIIQLCHFPDVKTHVKLQITSKTHQKQVQLTKNTSFPACFLTHVGFEDVVPFLERVTQHVTKMVLAKTSDLELSSDQQVMDESFSKIVDIYLFQNKVCVYMYIHIYTYHFHTYPELSSSHICLPECNLQILKIMSHFFSLFRQFELQHALYKEGNVCSTKPPFPSKRDNRKDVANFPRGSFPDWLVMGDMQQIYIRMYTLCMII